eukprot:4805854-Pleurochrysis_carterae.AAC.2
MARCQYASSCVICGAAAFQLGSRAHEDLLCEWVWLLCKHAATHATPPRLVRDTLANALGHFPANSTFLQERQRRFAREAARPSSFRCWHRGSGGTRGVKCCVDARGLM